MVVAASCRHLKRRLGPMAWAVLEDVALDAAIDDAGRLVATTSSRAVAEHLGLTPGTAARALGRLRALGLVSYTRQEGSAGRFGLAGYVLSALPGLEVRTCADGATVPRAADARAGEPREVTPRVDGPPMAQPPTRGRRRRAVTISPAGPLQLELLGDHTSEPTAAESQPDSPPDRSR